jgi:hypothetical protein
MRRTTLSAAALAAVFCVAACSNNNPFTAPTDTSTPATSVTETFDGQLTVNGAVTHPFAVQRVGGVTVRLTALDPTDVTVGLSLGTWNGNSNVCQVILANDAALGGATVVGTASTAGAFCVRIYDVGKLSRSILYTIDVTHF